MARVWCADCTVLPVMAKPQYHLSYSPFQDNSKFYGLAMCLGTFVVVAVVVDSKKKCLGIFLDLAKAFDTVSISILVNKMDRLGIRENALMILKDFLIDRTQQVKIGEHSSMETPGMRLGVSPKWVSTESKDGLPQTYLL
ncbi:unnamed protein product [Arctia plantaginis]|uniref:Reverse transcriptase domain-containing protein n=1 Tax=Arctia plantaginis TaxID=874455 RepID=A0A8S1AVH0_ARCPL|nr:unnamed protein product [Arctia plantaginis]